MGQQGPGRGENGNGDGDVGSDNAGGAGREGQRRDAITLAPQQTRIARPPNATAEPRLVAATSARRSCRRLRMSVFTLTSRRAARQLVDVCREGLRAQFEPLGHRQVWRPRVGEVGQGQAELHGVDGCQDHVAGVSPITCTPRIFLLPRSATILKAPRVSTFTLARGTCSSSSTRHSQSQPAASACASVRPTAAIWLTSPERWDA